MYEASNFMSPMKLSCVNVIYSLSVFSTKYLNEASVKKVMEFMMFDISDI